MSEARSELARIQALLSQAEQLNVWDRVVATLSTQGLEGARHVITEVREQRQAASEHERYMQRIEVAPPDRRINLNSLYRSLISHKYGSRDYRIARHALDRALADAEA